MFVKRNHTRHGAKGYQSILLVQGQRVPAKRRPGRPRTDAPPRRTVVVHETLANLSRPENALAADRRGDDDGGADTLDLPCQPRETGQITPNVEGASSRHDLDGHFDLRW